MLSVRWQTISSLRRIHLTAVLSLIFSSTAIAQTDVAVSMEQFGLGNAFRPGWFVGMRLSLTSSLTEPTPVWVQWEVPNADGDIGEYGRSLTLTPGIPALVWLYAPLGPDTETDTVWSVRVFEERDGVRKRELGGARLDPRSSTTGAAQKIDLDKGMIAVIGNRHLGLDGYSILGDRLNRPLGAHEDTRIIFGIAPNQLPDRWEGLGQAEALMWAGDRDQPTDLTLDQANAIREYVARGGHLVISLPAGLNIWGLGGGEGRNLLEDFLPLSAPRTDQAVHIRTLLPVLSKSDGTRGDIEVPIRVFKDLKGEFDATDSKQRFYEPLISLPDGRVVVIRRHYGFGWVTIIGIDLSDGRLGGLGLPQADAFWNRILGRRCDTPTFEEQQDIQKAERLSRMSGRDLNLGSGALFSELTNFPGEAGLGLLLALVLFAMYWLLAGPLGFALLKQYKQVKHAWVAFAVCAAVFTAVAWGAVGLLPRQLEVKHVTFLDRIARPPNQAARETNDPQLDRAISYFAVRLPGYRPTPMAIASLPNQRDLMCSWTPPGAPSQGFPNVDRYRVDVGRAPANFALPARATATTLYANWMGSVDPDNFGGTITFDPENPIRVEKTATGDALRGSIVNNLPGTLTNYTLIWVKSDRLARRVYERSGNNVRPWVATIHSGDPLNVGSMWRWDANNNPLVTGGRLDLGAFAGKPGTPLENAINGRYIEDYKQSEMAPGMTSGRVTETDRRNYMEMLTLFQQLTPPVYLRESEVKQDPDTVTAHRDLGRELDLSTWLTRPCVMLIGYVEDSPMPVPLRLNDGDSPPPSTGLTIVRWIYPLPLDEKAAFSDVFEEEQTP